MADAVSSQVLFDGDRLAVVKFTNISDGTGESAVLKVDVSALASSSRGQVCTGVLINRVDALTDGMGVDILWDATTDVLAVHIPQNVMYSQDFEVFGGLSNNAGAGKTGDILFTTTGHSSGDRYTLVLHLRKLF